MITLPPIKKKEIPRQYFAALDHLNGGLLLFYIGGWGEKDKKKSTHWSGKIRNECTQTQPARGYIYNTTETWFYTTSNLL